MFFSGFSPLDIVLYVLALIVSLSFHEAAHAVAANLLGDPTAKYQGRISLNPLRHLDPFGALFLVFVGFGWGKPVPVNPRHFSHPQFFSALVALAGPCSNIVLGGACAILASLSGGILREALHTGLLVNCVLAVFNLLPIPPLDGGTLVRPFLGRWAESFDQYGPLALFGVIAADMVFGTGILGTYIGAAASMLATMLNALS